MDTTTAWGNLRTMTLEAFAKALVVATNRIDAVGQDRDAMFFLAGMQATVEFLEPEMDDAANKRLHHEYEKYYTTFIKKPKD